MRHFAPGEQIYPYSAGPMLHHPDEDYNYREAAAGAAGILAAGGRVALGGHGEMHGLQAHWEMALQAEGGMAPHDVLRVATMHGAEAIGLDAELGSLEKGKLADLVVLDRDPLANIRNTQAIRYVMILPAAASCTSTVGPGRGSRPSSRDTRSMTTRSWC